MYKMPCCLNQSIKQTNNKELKLLTYFPCFTFHYDLEEKSVIRYN